MNPTPGRIVLYVTSADGMEVGLRVFFEVHDSDECARGVCGDLDFDPRYYEVPPSKHADAPEQNTWRWPPRS
jgi:hypothetical protein